MNFTKIVGERGARWCYYLRPAISLRFSCCPNKKISKKVIWFSPAEKQELECICLSFCFWAKTDGTPKREKLNNDNDHRRIFKLHTSVEESRYNPNNLFNAIRLIYYKKSTYKFLCKCLFVKNSRYWEHFELLIDQTLQINSHPKYKR